MLIQARVPDADQVARAVEKVYTRPELSPPPPDSVWDRFWAWVARGLAWLFDQIGFVRGLEFSLPIVYYVIVAVLVLAAVAILGYLVHTIVSRTRDDSGDGRPGKASAPGRPRAPADWDEEARRLAAEGRLREAAAALYQGLLLRLEKRGALRYDPSKTPGDYRGEVRPHAEASRTLTGFLRRYEPVAFGGRELDAGGYEMLRAAAQQEAARG